MKTAVIGSRGLRVDNLEKYLPPDTTEIVSGGAMGVDTCARKYAREKGLKLTEFRPDYALHGRQAPLIRNIQIIDYCDQLFAFWDGRSNGTRFVIRNCRKRGKPVRVFLLKKTRSD